MIFPESGICVWPFTDDGGLHYLEDEFRPHNFGDIPATEFLENESRIAVFESVYSLIIGYNKALSEKLNDVDAFADAYLKILGPKLTDDMLRDMRDHRVISFEGDMSENPVEVGFLEKPNADGTQENSLNRMERLIYQVSMMPISMTRISETVQVSPWHISCSLCPIWQKPKNASSRRGLTEDTVSSSQIRSTQ